MKIGDIKTVNKKELSFDVQKIDENFLQFDEKFNDYILRQVGLVISEVPENKYRIRKGSKILLSD